MWTVGELAEATGVTVRTLHHYDRIGLLAPTRRGDNGYRHYDRDDLLRLRRILFYRELEFPLDQIADLLDDTTIDEQQHLERQAALLDERINDLRRIRKAVTQALETTDMTTHLSPDDIREVFGDDYADKAVAHDTEAKERWGDTDAWRQSSQRTRAYSKDDWQEVKNEQDQINQAFAALLADGVPAEDERAMTIAEQHRRSIHDRFYDCSHEMHANLAEMYVADPRFTAAYESVATGLAAYIRDAILANGIHQS